MPIILLESCLLCTKPIYRTSSTVSIINIFVCGTNKAPEEVHTLCFRTE